MGSTYIQGFKFGFPRQESAEGSINPVEASLKSRKRVYILPSNASEVRIHDYNPLLLYFWKANVDIQFITELTLAISGYVTAYVTYAKISAIKDVWADIVSSGNIFKKLSSFATQCEIQRSWPLQGIRPPAR